eukprot:462734_1
MPRICALKKSEFTCEDESVEACKKKYSCNHCKKKNLGRAIATLYNHYIGCIKVSKENRQNKYNSNGHLKGKEKGFTIDPERIEMDNDNDNNTNNKNKNKNKKRGIELKDANPTYKKYQTTDDRSKQERNQSISNYMVPRLTGKELIVVILLLSFWMAMCGISANAFESIFFKAAMHILRPDFKTPSRTDWHGHILDGTVAKVKKVTNQEIAKSDACMLSADGSQDRTDKVTHIAALLPHPVLIAQIRNEKK